MESVAKKKFCEGSGKGFKCVKASLLGKVPLISVVGLAPIPILLMWMDTYVGMGGVHHAMKMTKAGSGGRTLDL